MSGLLEPGDPSPILEFPGEPSSPFLIVVDHASSRIPKRLGSLGLPTSELERHIACDIGALAVARMTAEELGATLIAQCYSRLVIDCNRDPNHAASIPTVSEATPIPGNVHISTAEIDARRTEIFEPYQNRIGAILQARRTRGRRTILVTQHSMTPVYLGSRRSMHAAVLYIRDRSFAGLVLAGLREDPDLLVAENQPYAGSDEIDYTIPRHAESRGLPYVELEIRQDLVAEEIGQRAWSRRVCAALRYAEHRHFTEALSDSVHR
jgi:predicted N-formylglutamate amidohydrolase